MHCSRHFLLLLLIAALPFPLEGNSHCFDHQIGKYHANSEFVSKTCSQSCTVMPFFSPDNALEAHLNLFEEAQESITIVNPTFESWDPTCSHNHNQCTKCCTGCDISYYRTGEGFPVFAALLNAINLRNVSIRILTNNYSSTTWPEKATMLDWLAVNNISVRMYKTTYFLHAKYAFIDGGKKTLISSVNYSKTSFMKNRESGVIISQCSDCETLKLYQTVFESDWEIADPYVFDNQYTDDQLKSMRDPAFYPYPIVKPPGERVPDIQTTMALQDFNDVQISGYVAPDNARKTFMGSLQNIQSKLIVHIYAITSAKICKEIVDLKNTNGINVTLLVSWNTAGAVKKYTEHCYRNLTNNGITIRKSSHSFLFSHQKYWIIDDKEVHLSTGNWAESDFPIGKEWPPSKAANRDMLVIMQNPSLVKFYGDVFEHDFKLGNDIPGGQ
ncbi:PREDICTED: uncharacterized protein LOC100635321 [Amphimedon queenslandica]|uniref:Mitochondrial cardiolipin hydrolase n=1 Tax=Amphimedon queenslandica TaxID=400682 RepID=A0A1X7U7J0_AMPQE|nr:PREDICTED: uncharacterized protein LOC100635321 [Amphimedon queenslandica]|eukprot:XP_003388786.2 PREDICTED: uncharacterized protein LOC100635321 [Amphimedon queenslandica]